MLKERTASKKFQMDWFVQVNTLDTFLKTPSCRLIQPAAKWLPFFKKFSKSSASNGLLR